MTQAEVETFNQYQEATAETAIYPEAGTGSYGALQYAALGLVNEAGEVAGKIKKIYRDNNGVLTEDLVDGIVAELGDTLYYLARVAKECGYPLGHVAYANISKLQDRKERGVLGGSGDNR